MPRIQSAQVLQLSKSVERLSRPITTDLPKKRKPKMSKLESSLLANGYSWKTLRPKRVTVMQGRARPLSVSLLSSRTRSPLRDMATQTSPRVVNLLS